jgi:YD repeat-containing protein
MHTRVRSWLKRLCLPLVLLAPCAIPAIADTQYSYDALGRLIRVRYDNGKEIVFAYDAAGNRLQRVVRTASNNRPPVANPDTVSLFENQASVTFNPRLNDTDPDGHAISLYSTSSGAFGAATLTGGGTTITYAYAGTGRRGAGDTLFYVIRDTAGGEASGEVTISFSNLAPMANNDTVTTAKNTAKTFDPRINDTDPGNDPFIITNVSTPLKGSVTIAAGGTALVYTPSMNAGGSDTFTYTVTDSDGASASATVSMTISPGLNAPVANADSTRTLQEQPVSLDPRLNDHDPDGDSLVISGRTNGAKGTVVINAGTSLTYTPLPGQTGLDSFTYTISDSDGQTATANIAVIIDPLANPSPPGGGGGGGTLPGGSTPPPPPTPPPVIPEPPIYPQPPGDPEGSPL